MRSLGIICWCAPQAGEFHSWPDVAALVAVLGFFAFIMWCITRA